MSAPPLQLGSLSIDPPVILAPMAGVSNMPFRRLCRTLGAGMATSEMITARALVEGREKTLKLARFSADESPKSLQLYGTEARDIGEAIRILVSETTVDHLDLNFGCPVRKVTRKGGGAALPARPELLTGILREAIARAGTVPLSIKFRLGIDETRLYFRETGRIAENEGCAAVTLHARTAAQLYDGRADWEYIAELKSILGIPVIGNGDIWTGEDALRMMCSTGCDGVAVGRGCLGRPWLFREIRAALASKEIPPPPDFGEVMDTMLEHARGLVECFGDRAGMLNFRKHAGWYTRAFPKSAALRQKLMLIRSLKELENLLSTLDRDIPYPTSAHLVHRGKRAGRQKVVLPHGYLDRETAGTGAVADSLAATGTAGSDD